MDRVKILWKARKRNALGLPWTFTVYSLSEDRLFIHRGFLNTRDDEVRLFRVTDLILKRSLWQRIIKTGTIYISSSDKAMGDFMLMNIKDSDSVKEQLSELVETARQKNRVISRENIDNDDYDDAEV